MTNAHPTKQISFFDGVCLIIGIMVGAGIFESSPAVAQHSPGASWLIALWTFGGVLSVLGALTYAGLATAFPETGGDYAFLKRAFGHRFSFYYAWSMLTVVRPGSIGAMAYVFARYANQLFPLGPHGLFLYACGCVVAVSVLNILGTRESRGVQDVLTTAKVLGITFLLLICLGISHGEVSLAATEPGTPSLALALIFVLFAYGGWNEIAFVASEVKDPERNLSRVLITGTVLVTILYVALNLGFLKAVGFEGLRQSDAVAHTIAHQSLSHYGAIFVSSLIAVSAFGAVHGMVFSGARIYYAMGQDHRLFHKLGQWSKRGTPFWSILTESVITLALMTFFSRSSSGFESLVLYTTPLFWVFMTAVGVSVFRLLGAGKPGGKARILWHPWTTLLFISTCLFMLVMSLQYAYANVSSEILWSLAILAVAVPLGMRK